MYETVFQTQFMLRSTKEGETHEDFFHRTQETLWAGIQKQQPILAKQALAVARKNNPNIKSAKEMFVYHPCPQFAAGGEAGGIVWRWVTAASCILQGIRLDRLLACTSVRPPDGDLAHDRSEISHICLQILTNQAQPLIRISYKTEWHYQPFAGFYRLPDIPYGTPGPLNGILAQNDAVASFLPCLSAMKSDDIHLKYPLADEVKVVENAEDAKDFLSRLRDPGRPIPFTVFMGRGRRMVACANELAEKTKAKAWTYLIPKPELVRGADGLAIRGIVKGIDLDNDFRNRVCRVFFPFGSYKRDDFANPSYNVSLLEHRRRRMIRQILRGELGYFEVCNDEWLETAMDVRMVQLDIRSNLDRHEAKTNLEAANREIERLQHERTGLESKSRKVERLENENQEIKQENQTIKAEWIHADEQCMAKERELDEVRKTNRDQEEQIKKLERILEVLDGKAKGNLRLVDLKDSANHLTHLEIADGAWDGFKNREFNTRFAEECWAKLRALNGPYYELFVQKLNSGNPSEEFKRLTHCEYTPKERAATTKNAQRKQERTFHHKGKEYQCWAHIKGGTGKANAATRVYFVEQPVGGKILVGWIGGHLTTDGSEHHG